MHWLFFTEQKVTMWEAKIWPSQSSASGLLQEETQTDNVYKGMILIMYDLFFFHVVSVVFVSWTLCGFLLEDYGKPLHPSLFYISSGLQRGPRVKNKRRNIMRSVSSSHVQTISSDSPAARPNVPTPHKRSTEEDAVVVAFDWVSMNTLMPSPSWVDEGNPSFSAALFT